MDKQSKAKSLLAHEQNENEERIELNEQSVFGVQSLLFSVLKLQIHEIAALMNDLMSQASRDNQVAFILIISTDWLAVLSVHLNEFFTKNNSTLVPSPQMQRSQ